MGTSVTFVNNEKVREMVPPKAMEMLSESRFTILTMENTTMAMQVYKEDNHLETVTPYYRKPLNRKEIQSMAQKLNCNFRIVDVATVEYAIAKKE